MNILNKIEDDIATYIKSGDTKNLMYLRNIKTKLISFSKEEGNSKKELTDEDYENELVNYVKTCKKNSKEYETLNKQEFALKELEEGKLASTYLSFEKSKTLFLTLMNDDELKEIVSKIIEDNSYSSLKDIKNVMDKLKAEPSFEGRIDYKQAGIIIKQLLT